MKKEKKTYIPPTLTVVKFVAERGYFASSVDAMSNHVENQIQMFTSQAMIESEIANGESNFVGGYMDGSAIDNSNPIGGSGWTFENGSYF